MSFSIFRTPSRVLCSPSLLLLMAASGCGHAAPKSHEQQVAEGRELYADNGCGTCHGPDGHGDGPVAGAMHITPRDFRNAPAFVNGYSVDQIAGTIENGLVSDDQSMPAYAHISADDRKLLAVFIMSLRDDSKPDAANTSNKENK